MEKGEALNIWSRRNKGGLDHMTALQVRLVRKHRGTACVCSWFSGVVVWKAVLSQGNVWVSPRYILLFWAGSA